MIPRILLSSLCFLAVLGGIQPQRAQAFTLILDITFDTVSSAPNAQAPLDVDALLLAIVLGEDDTFAGVQEGSWTTGDDLVLSAFSIASITVDPPIAGMVFGSMTIANLDPALGGSLIGLLWFPSFTLADYLDEQTPSIGDAYGYFRGPSIPLHPDFDGWQIPENPEGTLLHFLDPIVTETNQYEVVGDYADSVGFASFTVSPIPEPSVAFLLGSSLVLVLMARRRRARCGLSA